MVYIYPFFFKYIYYVEVLSIFLKIDLESVYSFFKAYIRLYIYWPYSIYIHINKPKSSVQETNAF